MPTGVLSLMGSGLYFRDQVSTSNAFAYFLSSLLNFLEELRGRRGGREERRKDMY